MRQTSLKRQRRNRAAAPVRDALVAKHGKCMICGHSPTQPWRNKPPECSLLCCHEIACGSHREKALDKPCAILVLCWWCNSAVTDKKRWPEARQLALLRARSPGDYDLAAYNALVGLGPNRVSPADVDRWQGLGEPNPHCKGEVRC